MDAQARMLAMAYRIDHRHADGSWGEMVEDRTLTARPTSTRSAAGPTIGSSDVPAAIRR